MSTNDVQQLIATWVAVVLLLIVIGGCALRPARYCTPGTVVDERDEYRLVWLDQRGRECPPPPGTTLGTPESEWRR
jgi:hypothetical protein